MFWINSVVNWLRASLSDPGYLPDDLEKPADFCGRDRDCLKCKMWKPERAHHCRQCGQCVFKMEAHCYWINNCVGAYNYKYFANFLIYSALTAGMTAFMQIDAVYCFLFADCAKTAWKKPAFWPCVAICIFTLWLSVYFCTNVAYLIDEQFESIVEN